MASAAAVLLEDGGGGNKLPQEFEDLSMIDDDDEKDKLSVSSVSIDEVSSSYYEHRSY